jgi:hypothetical protein
MYDVAREGREGQFRVLVIVRVHATAVIVA